MSWYEWLFGAGPDDAPAPRAGPLGPQQGFPQTVRRRHGLAGRRSNPPTRAAGGSEKPCERVYIRVYDLGQTFISRGLNTLTKQYGAFHSAVEVYGYEWSFGLTLSERHTGISWHLPGQNADHSFRETLAMGTTTYSSHEVLKVIQSMMGEWRGCTYDLFTRNCHTFSDVLCRKLTGVPLPSWVNALAGTGDAALSYMCVNPSAQVDGDGRAAIKDREGDAVEDPFSVLRKGW